MQFNKEFSLFEGKGEVLSIESPPEGRIRWRKIATRGAKKPTGMFPSKKMDRMMHFESPNELNAFRLLEADPSVRAYYEQPLRIKYELDGNCHFHVPDILILMFDKKVIWEVKTEKFALVREIEKRTQFMRTHLPRHGYHYQLVLSEELMKKPKLTTVCQLLHWGQIDISDHERECIRQIFLQQKIVPWSMVIDGYFGSRGRNLVSKLMLDGTLEWNVCQALTNKTELSLRTSDIQQFQLVRA